jgi:hypothetical protein
VFPWNTRVLLCAGSQLYSQIDHWSLVIGNTRYHFHSPCCTYSYMKYCVAIVISRPFGFAQDKLRREICCSYVAEKYEIPRYARDDKCGAILVVTQSLSRKDLDGSFADEWRAPCVSRCLSQEQFALC